MTTLKNAYSAAGEPVVPTSPVNHQAHEASNSDTESEPTVEMRNQRATPQDLLKAWDLDLWRLRHTPIKPDLKPLTAEELEALITRFPDVMPHIYVRPDAVLFGTVASGRSLMEVRRRDLVLPGEAQICRYVRGSVDVWEWCGGDGGTADVLAFNTLRVRAIHQTLAVNPLSR